MTYVNFARFSRKEPKEVDANKKEKIEHLVKASGPMADTNIHMIIILALSKYVYLEVDSDVKEWGAGMWTSF